MATGVVSGAVEIAIAGGSGLYQHKKGDWCARVQLVKGNGLDLTPAAAVEGNGLCLKHGHRIYSGEGIILGYNSPFTNIPLLGLIL